MNISKEDKKTIAARVRGLAVGFTILADQSCSMRGAWGHIIRRMNT